MRAVADESFMQAMGGGDDGKVFVQFELYPQQDAAASAEAGRPIFKDEEFIRIMVPGDKQNVVHRPVREADKRRFGRQYEAWRRGASESVTGTLLSEWPGVTRGQVKELEHFGVKTVEQLAAMSDGNAQHVGPVMALRQRARDYLEAAKGAAPALQLRAELEKRDNEMATMRRQLEEATAALAEMKRSRK